jgi:hypothetical protein
MINAVVGIALIPVLMGAMWLVFAAYDQIHDWWQIRRWHKEP